MKKTSILMSGLAIILMIMSQLFFSSNALASETQTVYLHKQATRGEVVSEAAVENSQGMLTEKQGVNGVEFTVIDITQFIRQSPSLDAALEDAKAVVKEEVEGLNVGQSVPTYSGMTVTAKGRTQRMALPDENGNLVDTDGILKLILAKRTASYDASYLIVETSSVDTCNPSDNLVLNFPFDNEEDEIHVYSKNDRLLELPSIEKILAENHHDFAYGEPIQYEMTVMVPTLIATYQYFQVVDIPDPALIADLSSLRVIANDEEVDPSWYQIEARDNGFVLNFNPSRLAPLNSQTLKISYQLQMVDDVEPDTNYYNKAYLRYHNSIQDSELESTSEEVLTGGYHFIKVDSVNREQVLSDASFVIRNEAGAYLTESRTWKNTEDIYDQELFRITSNQEGTFAIKGLRYGIFQLVEVVAPEGYRLLDQAIEFKIEKNTYLAGEQPNALLEVLNSKLPNPGRPGKDKPVTPGKLPRTGEMASTKGVILGSLLLISLFWLNWFQKRKRKEGEKEI